MKLTPDNIRNIIFGIEDSLVSTSGFLVGLASSSYSKREIFVAGLIIITVEAFSMGAGSFLTEEETNEIKKKKYSQNAPIRDGLLMLISYFIAGFIPLTPFIIFEGITAKVVSLLLSLISLFLLGYIPTKKAKSGIRMVIIAGIAASVGFIVGNALKF